MTHKFFNEKGQLLFEVDSPSNYDMFSRPADTTKAEPVQEPYAWELFFDNGKSQEFTEDKGEAYQWGECAVPVYLHPAPQAKPLNEIQRLDIIHNYFTYPDEVARVLQVLTDFEQTSGIKEQTT
jgi:hypothetical protein